MIMLNIHRPIKERRALDNYGSDLGELKYQSVAGIDENWLCFY